MFHASNSMNQAAFEGEGSSETWIANPWRPGKNHPPPADLSGPDQVRHRPKQNEA